MVEDELITGQAAAEQSATALSPQQQALAGQALEAQGIIDPELAIKAAESAIGMPEASIQPEGDHGVGRLGEHMLHLLTRQDATPEQIVGARLTLQCGTLEERGLLFLHDVLQIDAEIKSANEAARQQNITGLSYEERHKILQTDVDKLDSAIALQELPDCPRVIRQLAQAITNGQEADTSYLWQAPEAILPQILPHLKVQDLARFLHDRPDSRDEFMYALVAKPQQVDVLTEKYSNAADATELDVLEGALLLSEAATLVAIKARGSFTDDKPERNEAAELVAERARRAIAAKIPNEIADVADKGADSTNLKAALNWLDKGLNLQEIKILSKNCRDFCASNNETYIQPLNDDINSLKACAKVLQSEDSAVQEVVHRLNREDNWQIFRKLAPLSALTENPAFAEVSEQPELLYNLVKNLSYLPDERDDRADERISENEASVTWQQALELVTAAADHCAITDLIGVYDTRHRFNEALVPALAINQDNPHFLKPIAELMKLPNFSNLVKGNHIELYSKFGQRELFYEQLLDGAYAQQLTLFGAAMQELDRQGLLDSEPLAELMMNAGWQYFYDYEDPKPGDEFILSELREDAIERANGWAETLSAQGPNLKTDLQLLKERCPAAWDGYNLLMLSEGSIFAARSLEAVHYVARLPDEALTTDVIKSVENSKKLGFETAVDALAYLHRLGCPLPLDVEFNGRQVSQLTNMMKFVQDNLSETSMERRFDEQFMQRLSERIQAVLPLFSDPFLQVGDRMETVLQAASFMDESLHSLVERVSQMQANPTAVKVIEKFEQMSRNAFMTSVLHYMLRREDWENYVEQVNKGLEMLEDTPLSSGVTADHFMSHLFRSQNPETVIVRMEQVLAHEQARSWLLMANVDGQLARQLNLMDHLMTNDDWQSYVAAASRLSEIIDVSVLDEIVVMAVSDIISGSEFVGDNWLQQAVTKRGDAGWDQLKSRIGQFRDSVMNGEVDVRGILNSPFQRSLFQSMVRYKVSRFGSHEEIKFSALLRRSLAAQHQLPEGYVPSGDISVRTVDQERVAAFQLTDEAINQWRELAADIQRAAQWNADPEVARKAIITGLQEVISTRMIDITRGLQAMSEKLVQLPAAAQQKLQAKIEEQAGELAELRQMTPDRLTNMRYFYSNFRALGGYRQAASLLRTVLFQKALRRHPAAAQDVLDTIAEDHQPKLPDIQTMADFVEHIANRETWAKRFKRHGLLKAAEPLLSADSLRQDISRSLAIESGDSKQFKFIPNRGLLMELSGHIGDACWASKYDSIADAFPNFTSVIMVQNPGTKDARLAGSAMLIEANSDAGEKLLIIRGLNPIQNIITGLDQQSFFESFRDYARGIAEKRGRRLAVVIDSHSGGSGTNRPTLFSYMSEQIKPNAQAVRLADDPPTQFNGYNITRDTYLLT